MTSPRPSPPMTPLAWALLVLLGLIWGGSFFFARIAVQHVPPFTLVLLRLSMAAFALHLYIFGRYDLYASLKAHWKSFLFLGLINNALPHSLLFLGQIHLSAGLAAILNATTPIWTVIIANKATKDERFTPAKLAGCLIGLTGTAVLIGPAAFARTGIPLWALLFPIGASISYGCAAVFGRRFRALPSPVTAAGQLTASSLIMLPVSLITDRPWTLAVPPMTTVLAVLGLALLCTAFAYILFFRIITLAGATNVSLVTLLVPPGAILLGALFLGERLAANAIIGMGLIALGLLVLDNRMVKILSISRKTSAS
nr:DMT family transporter [uncultured Gellertiella sp.]